MVLRVRTEFTGVPGTPWLSTMFFAGGDQTAANAAVAAVADWWGDLDGDMTDEISWRTLPDVELINDSTSELQDIFSVTPETGNGGNVNERLSPATQALMRWRTGSIVNGREVRGRTFIPGLTEQTNDAGVPSSGFTASANAAAATLVGLGILRIHPTSRIVNPNPEVIAGSLWANWAVLRSRRD